MFFSFIYICNNTTSLKYTVSRLVNNQNIGYFGIIKFMICPDLPINGQMRSIKEHYISNYSTLIQIIHDEAFILGHYLAGHFCCVADGLLINKYRILGKSLIYVTVQSHTYCQVVNSPPANSILPGKSLPSSTQENYPNTSNPADPEQAPVSGIPFPPSYHKVPKGPDGFWRNFVNVETGSDWGSDRSCGSEAESITTEDTNFITTEDPNSIPRP